MTNDIWQYSGAWSGADLVGFHVDATDGHIGKVDKASAEVDAYYIVVDTGPWMLGTKVMLPAGMITSIDVEEHRIHVARTKDEIRNAPEFDAEEYLEQNYREKLAGYYGAGF